MSKIGFGLELQRHLQPAYEAALARLHAASPDDAQIVASYVSALRTECSGRRIEARELRVLAGVER